MLKSSEKLQILTVLLTLAVQLAFFLVIEGYFVEGRRGHFQIPRNASKSTIASLTGEGYDWSPRPLYRVLNIFSLGIK